jgi:hypothetical protein
MRLIRHVGSPEGLPQGLELLEMMTIDEFRCDRCNYVTAQAATHLNRFAMVVFLLIGGLMLITYPLSPILASVLLLAFCCWVPFYYLLHLTGRSHFSEWRTRKLRDWGYPVTPERRAKTAYQSWEIDEKSRRYMRQCKCGMWNPIASEKCGGCGTSQP